MLKHFNRMKKLLFILALSTLIFACKKEAETPTVTPPPTTTINPNTAPNKWIHEVMSYAMYRLLTHRFTNSPNANSTLENFTDLFSSYGYDENIITVDYSNNSFAALGNYIAQEIINFGLQDGSNEQNDYENQYYIPQNDPLVLDLYEDNSAINPNKWQPLAFDVYIDQSGNVYPLETPSFLTPEWVNKKRDELLEENIRGKMC